jgi:hypothetical protein
MGCSAIADIDKNRLYIKFGKTEISDLTGFTHEITEEAKKLKPGFTCLSDLRDFKLVDKESVLSSDIKQIATIQKTLKELGSSESARVVDPQVWLFVAMQEAEKDVDYHAIIFDDIEEAENAISDIESEIEEKNGEK